MINYLKQYYRRFRIRNKFFVIVSILLFIISVYSIVSLQISFNVYDEIIINQSSQILKLYTDEIENQLQKVERLTFDILSDRSNQEHFESSQYDTYDYKQYTIVNQFFSKLLTLANSERYIYSIGFLNKEAQEYSVGRYVNYLSDERKAEVLKKAEEKKGAIVWIEPSEDDPCVIAARQVRSISDTKTLATLVVRVSIEKLINSELTVDSQYKSELVILGENKVVLDENNIFKDFNIENFTKKDIEKLTAIKDRRSIISDNISKYTQWTYINILPYQNIFNKITTMKTVMSLCLISIFILTIYLGFKFSEGITSPIVALSKKMKKVEQGNFDVDELKTLIDDENADEIQQLNNDFTIMVNEINKLINENYVKQLVIRESQFKILQSQINPHFLYNTLASINGLAKINKQDKIASMVKALSNLLRSSIDNQIFLITLEEELELLNSYILIQKIRFEDRLTVNMEIDSKLNAYMILKLTLQPIVENAISYGVETITGRCEIMIKISAKESSIIISIEDNGPGIEQDLLKKINAGEVETKGNGIGLKNIQERIQLIFGNEYGMTINNKAEGGTVVSINIPYKLEV